LLQRWAKEQVGLPHLLATSWSAAQYAAGRCASAPALDRCEVITVADITSARPPADVRYQHARYVLAQSGRACLHLLSFPYEQARPALCQRQSADAIRGGRAPLPGAKPTCTRSRPLRSQPGHFRLSLALSAARDSASAAERPSQLRSCARTVFFWRSSCPPWSFVFGAA